MFHIKKNNCIEVISLKQKIIVSYNSVATCCVEVENPLSTFYLPLDWPSGDHHWLCPSLKVEVWLGGQEKLSRHTHTMQKHQTAFCRLSAFHGLRGVCRRRADCRSTESRRIKRERTVEVEGRGQGWESSQDKGGKKSCFVFKESSVK